MSKKHRNNNQRPNNPGIQAPESAGQEAAPAADDSIEALVAQQVNAEVPPPEPQGEEGEQSKTDRVVQALVVVLSRRGYVKSAKAINKFNLPGDVHCEDGTDVCTVEEVKNLLESAKNLVNLNRVKSNADMTDVMALSESLSIIAAGETDVLVKDPSIAEYEASTWIFVSQETVPEFTDGPIPIQNKDDPPDTPEAEQPKEVPPPAPAPQPSEEKFEVPSIRKLNEPAKRVTAEEVSPTLSVVQRRMHLKPTHTPAGLKLVGLFDEYKTMMSNNINTREENKKRIMKLHQIVQAACPRGLTNQQVAQDLVRTMFDKMAEGWGTIYRDENMFRLDYTLPGGPADVDKLDMFIQAMIQLIEASLGESDSIAYMNDRLEKIIDSPAIAQAMARLREGIEQRVRQRLGK